MAKSRLKYAGSTWHARAAASAEASSKKCASMCARQRSNVRQAPCRASPEAGISAMPQEQRLGLQRRDARRESSAPQPGDDHLLEAASAAFRLRDHAAAAGLESCFLEQREAGVARKIDEVFRKRLRGIRANAVRRAGPVCEGDAAAQAVAYFRPIPAILAAGNELDGEVRKPRAVDLVVRARTAPGRRRSTVNFRSRPGFSCK